MGINTNMTRAWAEIDLAAIRQNFNAAKAHAGMHGAKIIAVVKADAYGHGAKRIAKELEKRCGAEYFAVATLGEALELTDAGIKSPILLLSEIHPSLYDELVCHENIIPGVFSLENAKVLSEAAKKRSSVISCFLILDTGMSRIGIECTTAQKMREGIETTEKIAALDNIEITGIFSHYACADEANKSSALLQAERFNTFVSRLAEHGIEPEFKSMCNSAALTESAFGEKYDLARAGICLYGLNPSDDTARVLNLKPAMALRARVTNVKTVEAGVGISYGHTFVTERETRVATISVGYADGYPRLLSGKACVIIDDHPAPILGRICMDQLMVDVTDIPSAKADSIATLIGADERVRADRLAAMIGTIPYELICGISQRIPRIYTNAYDDINSD